MTQNEREWWPGKTLTTPHTRLTWSNLTEWLAAWNRLHHRAHSGERYMKESAHVRLLPVAMVADELSVVVLYDFLDVLHDSTGLRPPRGRRGNHPTTHLLVAANNRLAQLGAMPYKAYRQEQQARLLSEWRLRPSAPPPDEAPPHLSLFP